MVAGLLLLTTTSFSVSRMTCLMSGRTVLSWGMAADCCLERDSDGGPQLKAQCCVFSAANSDQHDYLPPTNTLWVPASLALDVSPVFTMPPIAQVFAARAMDDRPPPIGVAHRLALLGVRRI